MNVISYIAINQHLVEDLHFSADVDVDPLQGTYVTWIGAASGGASVRVELALHNAEEAATAPVRIDLMALVGGGDDETMVSELLHSPTPAGIDTAIERLSRQLGL